MKTLRSCPFVSAAVLLLACPVFSDTDDVRQPVEDRILTVSAAASLGNAFLEIERSFVLIAPDVKIQFNFGGSNHLLRQIQAAGGRGIDVFAPAGTLQVSTLINGGWVDRADCGDFASNEIVLIVPRSNPGAVGSFVDLESRVVQRVAIGAAKVPVGYYGTQVLKHLDLFDALQDKLVLGIHTRQVLDYVVRGEVDAGLVYASDAVTANPPVLVAARAQPAWHDPIRYRAAVLKSSTEKAVARSFVGFLNSGIGQSILTRHGFIAAGDSVADPTDNASLDSRPAAFDLPPGETGIWVAMKLSILAAGGAMLFVIPFGTALGALLAKRRFPGRELLDALLTLPMILPPTVTGYYLIIVLGSQSALGGVMEKALGLRVVLTLFGAAVASAVIALPLMVKSARAAFESVDREFEIASYTLGKGRLETLFRVTMPLAMSGLLTGAVLSFARAIGEFGATFMLAGLIPGRTMTMPGAIFHAFTNHEDRTAQLLVLVLTVFSVGVIYTTNRLSERQRRRSRS